MKKKKIEFHPNPQELWDEFHGVVAPVISVDGFEYECERQLKKELEKKHHSESLTNYYDSLSEGK